MAGGRIVFVGTIGAPRGEPLARARDAIGAADLVVCPEPFDVRAIARAGGAIVREAPVDELVLRARRGETVVRISVGAPDASEIAAAAGADLAVEVAWLDKSPLFGKRVLVTRTREQSHATAELLRARGAIPVIAPAIEIHPPKDPAKLTRAVERMKDALCVVFTSANGVARTWAEIAWQGRDARAFGGAKIAAIGPGTAQALAAHGITADVVAKEFKQEGLAQVLVVALAGQTGRVMLLRAAVARDALPNALTAAGYDVDVVDAYETRAPEAADGAALKRELDAGAIDVVTFTSSSTVQNLCDLLGADAAGALGRACVASIGPITTETCRARGVRVDVTAEAYTMIGLLDALEVHICSIDKAGGGRRS